MRQTVRQRAAARVQEYTSAPSPSLGFSVAVLIGNEERDLFSFIFSFFIVQNCSSSLLVTCPFIQVVGETA